MKKFFAASIMTTAAVLFVHPAMAAPSQVHWPWGRHHRHHHNQCKQACKDEYNRCKRNHGGHCKADRRACERSCH